MAGGCYVAASMIMVLMNKAVLSAFQFDCPNFLVFAQCATAVLFVKAAEFLGYVTVEPFNMEVIRRTPGPGAPGGLPAAQGRRRPPRAPPPAADRQGVVPGESPLRGHAVELLPCSRPHRRGHGHHPQELHQPHHHHGRLLPLRSHLRPCHLGVPGAHHLRRRRRLRDGPLHQGRWDRRRLRGGQGVLLADSQLLLHCR